MKKILSMVMATAMCFLLFGCGEATAVTSGNNAGQIAVLQEENKTLASEISALKEQLEKYSPIADVEAQISSLNEQVAGLESQIQEKQATLDDLTSKVDIAKLEENRKATEGVTVYEDKKVKINYIRVGKDPLRQEAVVFLVENKTDVTLTIQCEILALDYITINDYITMSDAVAPQSKGYVYARADVSNNNPSVVSGELNVIDFDSYNSYGAKFVNVEVQ